MQENNFKKKVREAYLSCLMEELAHARRGHAEAKRDTIAAEGRMVTRYDSTKTEVGWLADGFLKDVRELEKCILEANEGTWFREKGEAVGIDSLVRVREEDGYECFYYIVRERGGVDLAADGRDVYCVSVSAPIAKELFGKKIGERTEVKGVGQMQIVGRESEQIQELKKAILRRNGYGTFRNNHCGNRTWQYARRSDCRPR